MSELYLDGDGVAFGQYRELLPARAADFPNPHRVKAPDVLEAFCRRWDHCMVCGKGGAKIWRLELHHLCHGTVGRCDSATNLIRLCGPSVNTGTCHSDAHGGVLRLGTILWVKWRLDAASVSWVRLALLLGRFLPDLEPDDELEALYWRNQAALTYLTHHGQNPHFVDDAYDSSERMGGSAK